jgi:hypothetical protein
MPSSVIAAMQYNAEKRALTIVYRGKRGTYRYYNVAREEYDEFLAAPSKGTYLNQTFKARQHPFERLMPSQSIHLVSSSTPTPKASGDLQKNGKDDRRGHS